MQLSTTHSEFWGSIASHQSIELNDDDNKEIAQRVEEAVDCLIEGDTPEYIFGGAAKEMYDDSLSDKNAEGFALTAQIMKCRAQPEALALAIDNLLIWKREHAREVMAHFKDEIEYEFVQEFCDERV
jgi:hypothetical protein